MDIFMTVLQAFNYAGGNMLYLLGTRLLPSQKDLKPRYYLYSFLKEVLLLVAVMTMQV